MKIVRLIISIILLFITSCSSIRSSEEISLKKTENSKILRINYDKRRYSSVKLDNIVIDSGQTYYIQKGKYILSYSEEGIINGYVGVSWKGSKKGSSNRERRVIKKKVIEIIEDMEINLKNHDIQVNFSGTINSSKKF